MLDEEEVNPYSNASSSSENEIAEVKPDEDEAAKQADRKEEDKKDDYAFMENFEFIEIGF